MPISSNIDDMKSVIFKKGGVAVQNRFNVIFTPPKRSLLNLDPGAIIGQVISGSFSVKNLINDPRDTSFLCDSVVLPGRQITTQDYIANKYNVPIPYTNMDADVTMKFILTNDYYMKKMFDDWQDQIINTDDYTVGYKKDFQVDVVIQQLDVKNTPIYGVKLENAFPTTVSAVELGNDSGNAAQELSITMSYDRWVPEGPVSSTLSGLRQAAKLIGI